MENKNKKIIFFSISFLLVMFWLFPYLYLTSSAFKPNAEVISIPARFFPTKISVENFVKLFDRLPVFKYIGNSLVVAIVSTGLSVILGSLTAYAITRSRLSHTSIFITILVLSLKMIPTSIIAVPIYEIIINLKLYDTKLALIIVYVAINIPFVIWVMMGFFSKIPRSLDEAACIDGASTLNIFTKIILPISLPGLSTAAIFTLFTAWNEFLIALLLTSINAKTFTVCLSEFLSAYNMDLGPMCAGAFLFSFPVLIISMLGQKFIVKGMIAGAVKE